ncbi:MAG: Organic solvent tolerance protein OstA [Flammeovirgaceae bacterium]|nr:Organic solvent tolerance protein OstA [Flammeovirgaceae bacterium]
MINRLLLISLILLFQVTAIAQKRVKLKSADTMRGGTENNERFDWVIGNVVFVQNQTTIYCDSAIFHRSKNQIEAFGKIRIQDGDSVSVTASKLNYDGDKKIAYLRKNVIFDKLKTATLYTDFLDFDRVKNVATYFNGGKVVDSTNTLTSKKGYYNVNTNMASFKKDVNGVNKDYELTSDTLQYNTRSKVIYFQAFTTLKDKEGGVAYYQNGYYDTTKKLSTLSQGEIETESYKLKGDAYFIDDKVKMYKARGRVAMTSKEENLVVFGDAGDYDKEHGVTKVYGNAYLTKIADNGDSLFLSADTLVSIENEDPSKKRMLAYNNVLIYKSDLQGTADSLSYSPSDSTLYFYNNPVLWSEENQMSADSVWIQLSQGSIDKLFMVMNAFVIAEDTLKNFNQIKGRKMVANFKDDQIHHVDVQGNGESLYFAIEEAEAETEDATIRILATVGMNKIICSNMKINFLDGKLNNISFYVNPDASFIPPHELNKEDQELRGFIWRGEERPTRSQVVKQ